MKTKHLQSGQTIQQRNSHRVIVGKETFNSLHILSYFNLTLITTVSIQAIKQVPRRGGQRPARGHNAESTQPTPCRGGASATARPAAGEPRASENSGPTPRTRGGRLRFSSPVLQWLATRRARRARRASSVSAGRPKRRSLRGLGLAAAPGPADSLHAPESKAL